ncbi:MAG: HPr family phosphocarrier protein [Hyphomicrobiales bacterium]|nr:HPr family phosphocarrier protein [Hyphomicrobiales bacterium]
MNAAGSSEADGEIARDFLIINQRGLHARASAKFVQLADSYRASITVEKDGIRVGGTSIMGLMMLAASPGCSIRVTARGPDAETAIDAIEQLIAARFGEEV